MNRDAIMNPLTLNEIGIDALSKALSPVDVARFLRLYDKGSGDYTEEREQEVLKKPGRKNTSASYMWVYCSISDPVGQLVNVMKKTGDGKWNARLDALLMQINPHFLYNITLPVRNYSENMEKNRGGEEWHT